MLVLPQQGISQVQASTGPRCSLICRDHLSDLFQSLSTPRFNFFEKEIVKDPARENQVFDLLKVRDDIVELVFQLSLVTDTQDDMPRLSVEKNFPKV